ncbi:uncharacterized protein UV8b_07275 [Ustilaginoidea virens]|uniref:Uncharacterized protein n=1 Tax=Ustilaginoidea virens TaxID=1159556 RepID=A0A8E5HWT7_USTVR|nr:uncharacterized protein UV8b_07275 [Ustilaginoidea virens]QUC23034.1 hypothetical protein UV8b_07275 [Ustilaginoidea virens]
MGVGKADGGWLAMADGMATGNWRLATLAAGSRQLAAGWWLELAGWLAAGTGKWRVRGGAWCWCVAKRAGETGQQPCTVRKGSRAWKRLGGLIGGGREARQSGVAPAVVW